MFYQRFLWIPYELDIPNHPILCILLGINEGITWKNSINVIVERNVLSILVQFSHGSLYQGVSWAIQIPDIRTKELKCLVLHRSHN